MKNNLSIPISLVGFLLHFLKKQKFAFFYIVITALVWAGNEAMFPYFIKAIINTTSSFTGHPADIFYALRSPLVALVMLWILMEFSMRTQGLVIMKSFPRLRATIRDTVFSYVQHHSHRYFANHFAGHIAAKISDLPSSTERLLEILFLSFFTIIFSFSTALLLLWLANPYFAIIATIWAFLHFSFLAIFFKSGYQRVEQQAEAVTNLSGKIVDTLTNVSMVRLFAGFGYEKKYLAQHQQDEINKSHKASWHFEKMKFLQGLVGTFFIFAMIFLLIDAWTNRLITIGDFALVIMLSFNMLGFVWYVSFQVNAFVREAGKITSALSLISVPHEIQDIPAAKELVITQGQICFANVTFGYGTQQPLFQELSVSLAAGTRVGLVGFSGSGKTTFVNLILRLFDINSGAILLDGQNIAEVTQDSLRKNIATIPQEPLLFHRSILENIRYGRLTASDEEVMQAAAQAHCDEFIEMLPEGYHTIAGERGVKLSGGQRQRIAIARAILKKAPILLLDEATSALDTATERIIQQSFHYVMKDRTTIVIAHRLSTLTTMDRILVFDQGRIVEDGTIDQLLRLNGQFAHLWRLQHNGFLPEAFNRDVE